VQYQAVDMRFSTAAPLNEGVKVRELKHACEDELPSNQPNIFVSSDARTSRADFRLVMLCDLPTKAASRSAKGNELPRYLLSEVSK
jgi:hypothetical protein